MAYCTDRADSDGCGTGKKKALVWKTEGNFIRSIFLLLILHCFHTLQYEDTTNVWRPQLQSQKKYLHKHYTQVIFAL